ncbi:UMP-CMP kinase [Cystobasidium minutum MCA 4210]|uniref:UMP-CMP kinase n=1 Tax=Cystobasidium minutum MCA 4210 TaxID=1397322 RepID=UPI0034CD1FB6|eukprot:jgi/Rhomi1/146949/e_gw1.7.84.1
MPLPAATGAPGSASTAASTTTKSTPAFDPAHITVVYVLGGPGAGKGTQCAKLVSEKNFVHLSAGDLLRAEQNREGSQVGQLIRQYIREGTIVPMEITIGLLKTAMQEEMDKSGKTKFLIDGFPRKLDQAFKFDETVCPGSAVLFLTCPESVLLERLLERGKTSGREDDNAESISKRFRTFIETSMPVVDHYRKEGKVVDIDSSKSIDAVYEDISGALDRLARRKSISLEGGAQ